MLDMGSPPRPRIILASRSPRRRQLAIEAGWEIEIIPPPDEAEAAAPGRRTGESLEAYVLRLARAKAEAVAASGVRGLILACDTLSEVDGRELGQAASATEARSMLESLSGRRHRVVTGVCLWLCPERAPCCATDESELEMGPLEESFLEWYLDSGLWRGKAGACGFQDERLPLRLIAGSPSNVVGLPLELIRRMLAEIPQEFDSLEADKPSI
jgi:septum formation protein